MGVQMHAVEIITKSPEDLHFLNAVPVLRGCGAKTSTSSRVARAQQHPPDPMAATAALRRARGATAGEWDLPTYPGGMAALQARELPTLI